MNERSNTHKYNSELRARANYTTVLQHYNSTKLQWHRNIYTVHMHLYACALHGYKFDATGLMYVIKILQTNRFSTTQHLLL